MVDHAQAIREKESDAGHTVMLVDPDPSIAVVFREFFKDFFSGEAYIMLHTASAWEALDRLKSGKIDLIITDLRLAHYSGLSLLARARAVPYNVPIIVMSAFTDLMSEEEWKMLGATEFISKPPDRARLRETISRILGSQAGAASTKTGKHKIKIKE